MIKFVFFDVGGVLKGGLAESKNRFSDSIGLHSEQYHAFYSTKYLALQTGKLTKKQFFADLKKEFNLNRMDLESIWDEVFHHNYLDFPEVKKWALGLKKKYTVGIISNVSELTKGMNAAKGVYAEFEPLVFLSCDIGKLKPNADILEYINEKTQSKPGECILIDDKERNTVAAQKHGWHAIVHVNLEQTKKEFEQLTKSNR